MNAELLLAFLRDNGFIDQLQMDELMEEQSRSGKTIEQVIENSGVITMKQIYALIAQALGTEVVDVTSMEFPPALLSLVAPHTARQQGVLPLDFDGQILRVACANPLDPHVYDNLRFSTQKDVAIYVAPATDIQAMVERFYGAEVSNIDDVLATLAGEAAAKENENGAIDIEGASAQPIIKYVNTVLAQAIQARASDIHFEPFEQDFKIRYRVDGALYEMSPPPRSLATSITSRIKVMSNLNIAERRIPQDGRIQTTMAGRQVDLRVSTLPTQFGESVVLRVLDRTTVRLDLDAIGMPKRIYDYICAVIEKPNGIFIVTGPTGSGKTTTLYACLNRINTTETKLLTAEEPVEYEIDGIQQVPIHEAIDAIPADAVSAVPIGAGSILVCAWLAWRDARAASRLMLGLELFSMAAILVLAIVILVHVNQVHGWTWLPFRPARVRARRRASRRRGRRDRRAHERESRAPAPRAGSRPTPRISQCALRAPDRRRSRALAHRGARRAPRAASARHRRAWPRWYRARRRPTKSGRRSCAHRRGPDTRL